MPADEERSSRSGAGQRIRSSTEERERAAAILRAAAEAGLLTLDEADERLATCYQSQYRDEIAPLLADLPEQGRRLVPPAPADEAETRQFRRASAARLWGHASGSLFLGLLLVGIWAATGGGFFWPAWPLAFLALSVIFRAKHRARMQRWREYAEHNGFGRDYGFEWSGPAWDGPFGRRGCQGRGPWWAAEERASRGW